MKVVVIGAVVSTKKVIEKLLESDNEILMVFSLDDAVSKDVSGYYPLHELAEINGIPYKKYTKINDEIDVIEELHPDYIFAVGFSQLISERIIQAAKYGTIGFHPTPLPKMRGRAAMVWQVLLGITETKCTMFLIDSGMDSGDIIAQEPYYIGEDDYAIDVEKSLLNALDHLMDTVIDKMRYIPMKASKQNEDDATYLLKRSPEDGLIDWNQSIFDIHRLIRAVSHPYPGAFSNYDGRHKLIFWRANILKNNKYIGMNGQIAKKDDSGLYIVCKDGLLHITDYENVDNVKLLEGHKLKGETI